MNFLRNQVSTAAIMCCALAASQAMAWGNRGHDALTVTATRIAAQRYKDPKFVAPLFSRTEMLAHLANIPDIYWKSLPREERKILDTAHFYDVNLVKADLQMKSFPKTLTDVLAQATAFCKFPEVDSSLSCDGKSGTREIMQAIGSAPWRVEQLAFGMESSFAKAKEIQNANGDESQFKAAVDDALFYGGLLSHFVGDLSMPLHTSSDHDAYGVGLGGLHYYFEDLLVDQLNFGFYDEVKDYAIRQQPVQSLVDRSHTATYVEYATNLALNSFSTLSQMYKLDRKFALIKPSSNASGLKVPAERKAPSLAVNGFRPFLKARFAYGADALSTIWYEAWKRGGAPDLSKYKSYDFRLKPDPIPLSYLDIK